MSNEIPGLVRAQVQVQVHLSDTILKLESVRAELQRTAVGTARSRVLRHLREQLEEQLDAWEYLSELTRTGEHYAAYREVNE